MSSRKWPLAVFFAFIVAEAAAQNPTTIWQAHALATSADSKFFGAGFALARRAGGRLVYQLSLTPGVAERAVAVRSEAILAFSLDPARRDGVSPYGGGGVAVLIGRLSTDAFLVLLLGLESAPQARSGWFVEIGVGGGVRGSVGWRLRH